MPYPVNGPLEPNSLYPEQFLRYLHPNISGARNRAHDQAIREPLSPTSFEILASQTLVHTHTHTHTHTEKHYIRQCSVDGYNE